MDTALAELNVESGLDALEEQIQLANQQWMGAERLQNALETKGYNLDMAYAAESIVPNASLLRLYHQGNSSKERLYLAQESLVKTVKDAIAATMQKVAELIKKAVQWLIAALTRKNSFQASDDQVKEVRKILGDHELKTAMEVAFAEASKARPGLEDYFANQSPKTSELFNNFQNSLTEEEVEFLTSGHHYKMVRDAVSDFTGARFSEFIQGYETDLCNWAFTGIMKAAHIGSGEDAVNAFINAEQKEMRGIQEKYARPARIAREMTEQYLSSKKEGGKDRLKMFFKKPSELYPYLDKIWSDIHFERISQEDASLMTALKDVQGKYDKLMEKFQSSRRVGDKPWPPEEAVIKLIAKGHQEGAKSITDLLKIVAFLKASATHAYNATIKSFNYIVRILNEISKMPGVKLEKVLKSLDIIQTKRKELTEVMKLV